MGKRLVKWTLDGKMLKLSKHLEDPKAEAIIEAEFDLDELILALDETEDFKLQAVAYLAKQRMMDTGANEVGEADGKVTAAKKRWAELVEGKWTAERVNATGKSANKKFVAAVTEQAKVISLEGLVMKKAMAGLPGQPVFTEEDAAKLQEFLMVAAKYATKNA
jgi:hypothetical protein